VVFRSGNMITGQLTAKPGDPRVKVVEVDYTKVGELTLDVTLEYPGLNGTLSIPRKEIKEVRKLQNLDATTMKKLQDELKRVQEAAVADEAARKAAEGRRDAEAQAATAKPGDTATPAGTEASGAVDARLKAGLDLLARYPPPEWGPHKVAELVAKAGRKQPITPTEKEFADNIGLWQEALNFKKAEEEKKKKAEEAPKAPAQDKAPEKK
jgi:hypothetical protein